MPWHHRKKCFCRMAGGSSEALIDKTRTKSTTSLRSTTARTPCARYNKRVFYTYCCTPSSRQHSNQSLARAAPARSIACSAAKQPLQVSYTMMISHHTNSSTVNTTPIKPMSGKKKVKKNKHTKLYNVHLMFTPVHPWHKTDISRPIHSSTPTYAVHV